MGDEQRSRAWEPRAARRWRTGRANPRNLYWYPDGADPALEPRGWERQIGTLDTPELAQAAVMAHNAYLDSHERSTVTAEAVAASGQDR